MCRGHRSGCIYDVISARKLHGMLQRNKMGSIYFTALCQHNRRRAKIHLGTRQYRFYSLLVCQRTSGTCDLAVM